MLTGEEAVSHLKLTHYWRTPFVANETLLLHADARVCGARVRGHVLPRTRPLNGLHQILSSTRTANLFNFFVRVRI